MAFARGFVLGRKSPFGLEHPFSERKKSASRYAYSRLHGQGLSTYHCTNLCSMVGDNHPPLRSPWTIRIIDIHTGEHLSSRSCLQYDISR